MTTTRRSVLSAGAAAAALAGLSSRSFGQQTELVVATWGGDYGQVLRDTIDQAHFAPKGITVLQNVGTPDTRKARLLSERGSRRGSIDVGCFDDTDSYLLSAQQLTADLAERTPRYGKIIPSLRTGYSAPHIHSPLAVIYNTNAIKTPPAGFSDFWDPRYRGRVGLVDISYQYAYAMAAVTAGPNMSDYGPAEARLRELRALEPKVYPSVEALAAGLKSEEVWLGPMFMARGLMWQRAGIPVRAVIPAEGTVSVAFHAVVPRNSGNADQAVDYVDRMLDPAVQTAFAAKMGYAPTVVDAVLPAELQDSIALTEEQQGRIRSIDHRYVARNLQQMINFWNRDFKR